VKSGVDKKLTAFGFLDVEFGWPGDGGIVGQHYELKEKHSVYLYN
jgi:hypothetical protein